MINLNFLFWRIIKMLIEELKEILDELKDLSDESDLKGIRLINITSKLEAIIEYHDDDCK